MVKTVTAEEALKFKDKRFETGELTNNIKEDKLHDEEYLTLEQIKEKLKTKRWTVKLRDQTHSDLWLYKKHVMAKDLDEAVNKLLKTAKIDEVGSELFNGVMSRRYKERKEHLQNGGGEKFI